MPMVAAPVTENNYETSSTDSEGEQKVNISNNRNCKQYRIVTQIVFVVSYLVTVVL